MDFCISSGQVFRWQKIEEQRWIGADGDSWFDVRRTNSSRLSVTSNAGSEIFESLFRLDWKSRDIEVNILKRAPELQPYIAALPGHRLMRPSDPIETFFCFLCTSNNNIKRITQMVAKLASRGRLMAEVKGNSLYRFPSALAVSQIPEEALRAEGFGYRGASIPQAAKDLALRGGSEYLRDLAGGPYLDARKELLTIKGVGPKLADCICLFGLHFDEAVPIDTHIWQAMVRLYFPQYKGQALTEKRYYEAADFFRGRLGKLAGWAHQYLFYENVLNWRSRR